MPDNPSTELALIGLLREGLTEIRRFGERICVLEKTQEKIMTAIETLTESVNAAAKAQTELTTAVNAAIVQLGTPSATDAQILTAAAAVDANTASDVALTKALTDAVNPPTPVP